MYYKSLAATIAAFFIGFSIASPVNAQNCGYRVEVLNYWSFDGLLDVLGSNQAEKIAITIEYDWAPIDQKRNSRLAYPRFGATLELVPYVVVERYSLPWNDLQNRDRFLKSDVNEILVSACAGDDIVVNDTDIPSTLLGGSGSDWIYGGEADDKILGDSESYATDYQDFLFGGGGDDYLDGGGLYYNHARDYIYGGKGDDILIGEKLYFRDDWFETVGDNLYGGPGADEYQFSNTDLLYDGSDPFARLNHYGNEVPRSWVFGITSNWIYPQTILRQGR